MERIGQNKILNSHGEWLRNNGYYKEADECFEQAKKYTDLRRLNGRKNYEATNLHASSNGMGNAHRVSRLKRA
jgi:Tfp pilus assembly protein PilF